MELYRLIRKLERQLQFVDSIDDASIAAREKRELIAKKLAVINDMITSVDDPELRQIMTDRYLKGLRWEQVAKKYGYSISHLYRLRLRAILALID